MSDRFVIKKFDPLRIEIPNVEYVSGTVTIILPEFNLKLIDLSLGGAIDGTHVGSKEELYAVTITLTEDTEVSKIVQFIVKALPELIELHKAYQDELNKHYLLDEVRKRK